MNITPVCLPQPDEKFKSKYATAAGWGATDKAGRYKYATAVRYRLQIKQIGAKMQQLPDGGYR